MVDLSIVMLVYQRVGRKSPYMNQQTNLGHAAFGVLGFLGADYPPEPLVKIPSCAALRCRRSDRSWGQNLIRPHGGTVIYHDIPVEHGLTWPIYRLIWNGKHGEFSTSMVVIQEGSHGFMMRK